MPIPATQKYGHSVTESQALQSARRGGFTGVRGLLADIPFGLNVSQRSNLAMTPFMVGSRLSGFQAIAGSLLYIFAAMSGLMSSITDLEMVNIAVASSPQAVRDAALSSGTFWQLYLGSLMTIGILVSLYFMWDVRRKNRS